MKEKIIGAKNAEFAAERLGCVDKHLYPIMFYGNTGKWMMSLIVPPWRNNQEKYISIWIWSDKTIRISRYEKPILSKGVKFQDVWSGKAKTQKEWVKWIRGIARYYGVHK